MALPGFRTKKPSAAAWWNGMCEWPKITASASGKRRRSRPSRPASGPPSCTTASRSPATSTLAVSGRRARTAASSTFPCTATSGVPIERT